MITRIQKWGNSQGIRLSKELLKEADLCVGEAVDVTHKDGTVVLTPARRVRGGHDLAALVAALPADERAGESDWGPASGTEVW
ncbi:MAG: AbrB/MazE/SpoVT family DNA-binding domain-containing protein [Coriobacteriia bacterium]